ncbi:MAG: MarR family transcriptional regulator, partial [Oscillospiraceae bacterium]
MTIANAVNQFYFDMNLNELRLMAKSKVFPAITYNSLMYLDIIAYKDNCTVSFLADAFNVAKSAVTLKINELIRQGLV